MNRKEIAKELLAGCPNDALSDYQEIANALVSNKTAQEILDMPETNAWPETYIWIKILLS